MTDFFIVIAEDSLYLRDAPKKEGSNTIDVLHHGDVVEKLGDVVKENGVEKWQPVKTAGGKTGWASIAYLKSTAATSTQYFSWFEKAIEEYNKHIKEVEGSGDNPRIVEYLQSTDLGGAAARNDETPWCSAFVNWCVEQSGNKGTDSAWARSWLEWGKELNVPIKGCIVVFKRPPSPSSGHVAFFVSQTDTHIKTLGGNQGNSVSIAEYSLDRVISYRIPKDFAFS